MSYDVKVECQNGRPPPPLSKPPLVTSPHFHSMYCDDCRTEGDHRQSYAQATTCVAQIPPGPTRSPPPPPKTTSAALSNLK